MQNINYAFLLSRPVWGAWIEIEDNYDLIPCDNVAPRMGRVD